MIKILQSIFETLFENHYRNLFDFLLPFHPPTFPQPPRFPAAQPSVKTWKGFVNRIYERIFQRVSKSSMLPGRAEGFGSSGGVKLRHVIGLGEENGCQNPYKPNENLEEGSTKNSLKISGEEEAPRFERVLILWSDRKVCGTLWTPKHTQERMRHGLHEYGLLSRWSLPQPGWRILWKSSKGQSSPM